ncbi:unnamed protein product [Sympodiomycopsis kandeliae]
MSAGTEPSAPAMSASSSSMDPPGFDLPPMPVPYEDFHFSLDLPDNIEPSDLSLLEKGDFDTLFGPSSVTGTPAIISSSALFGTATPALHTPAGANTESSNTGGPDTESQDAVMNNAQSETTPTASHPPWNPMTSKPPPPPDFSPPANSSNEPLFTFDSLFGASSGNTGSDSKADDHSQVASGSNHQNMSGIAIPSNAVHPAMPLFDTSESDFLSNFLEGFEASWDFNPSLPDNMPSYAAAAAAAQSRLGTSGNSSSSSGQTVTTPGRESNTFGLGRGRKGMRGNSNASSHPTPPDLQSQQQQQFVQQQQHFFQQHYNGYSHPPHGHMLHHHQMHPHHPSQVSPSNSNQSPSSFPASAVFGGHLAGVVEDEPNGVHGTGSKRSFNNGRVGEEKRRGSLAQVGSGFYQPPPHQHQQNSLPNQSGHMGASWFPGMDSGSSQMPFGPAHAVGNGPAGAPQYHPHPQGHATSTSSPATRRSLGTGATKESPDDSGSNSNSTPKRELLTEKEKRQNHILSEQRRRNHIREGFTELVSLLDLGRLYGARGLGLSSGAGTGIEDEGLDDRTDVSSDEESDEEAAALAKARRKKARAKKNALLTAAASQNNTGTAASRGRGKGRGRGGSAGGGAGSKSAVLFQAVDLIQWLEVRNAKLESECVALEEESGLGSEPFVTEQSSGQHHPKVKAVGTAAA